jgi:hypothetical protein
VAEVPSLSGIAAKLSSNSLTSLGPWPPCAPRPRERPSGALPRRNPAGPLGGPGGVGPSAPTLWAGTRGRRPAASSTPSSRPRRDTAIGAAAHGYPLGAAGCLRAVSRGRSRNRIILAALTVKLTTDNEKPNNEVLGFSVVSCPFEILHCATRRLTRSRPSRCDRPAPRSACATPGWRT